MKRSFTIQAVVWHEVAHLLDVDPIHEALTTYVDLASYGGDVEQIDFTYILVKLDNIIHSNEVNYLSENKTVEVKLKLSYPHAVASEPHQVLKMMASLFLVSIDLYPNLSIPNFDTPAFKRDCQHLFDTKGWVEQVGNR